MSQLRKEYSKSKSKKEEIVSKAALNWLAENVIIINEKLDRKSVKRLINSIQKFEETFGPFADRVPSIKLHLDAAETGLELVITGRSSERKTSNLLKQMSYLYSALSGFFAKDLPILLRSRFFRAAKEQPDQRMDMLPSASPEGHKHNPQIIQDAIATALKPSKDEKKLLKKMYRSTKLPELEPRKIARDLMSLSYNDLEKLTQIGKTPMVTTPDEVVEEPEAEAPEQEVATESTFRRTGQLLTENVLTEASIGEVGPILQQLTSIVKNAGLDELQNPLNDLYTQLMQFLGSDKGTQLKQTIQQARAKGGSIADLFKTPGGKLLKQANMAIETLKGLGQAWPDIQPFTQKPQISDKDILDIKNLIAKQVGGGFFKKAAQAFGVTTKPFPGLEPESIVDALTKSTLGEQYMRFHAGVVLERRLKEQDEGDGMFGGSTPEPAQPPAGDEAEKGVQKLANAMTALHQFATGASGSAKTSGAQASTSTGQTQQTQNTSSTSGTETAGTGPASGKEVAGSKENVSALKQSFPNLTDNQYSALAAGLEGAGYKIVKK